MTTTTARTTPDFTNAAVFLNFVDRVAGELRVYHNATEATRVDFGEDNGTRPPVITLAPTVLPVTTQPRITFRFVRGKLEITAGWPYTVDDGGWGRPLQTDLTDDVTSEIKVTATKAPYQVARDIRNRLLPNYLRLHKELQRRIAAHQQSQGDDQAIAARLAGDCFLRGTKDSPQFTFGLGLGDQDGVGTVLGSAWGDVTVAHGKVTIELRSLTEEQAAVVLAALGVRS